MKFFVFQAKADIPVAGVKHTLYNVLSETGEFMNLPLVLSGSSEDDVTLAVYTENPNLTDHDVVELVDNPEGHEGVRGAYKAHLEATKTVRAEMKENRAHIAELHGIVVHGKS